MGWIGVDLDGTLAEWGEGTSNPGDVLRIGNPLPRMVQRVKQLLAEGVEVRIFTARVGPATDQECVQAFQGRGVHPPYPGEIGPLPQRDWDNYQRTLIEDWCRVHLGYVLPITATKDFHMYQLYDDRCVEMVPNTGRTLREEIGEGIIKALRDSSEVV